MALRKHDETNVKVNGWLTKKEYAFPYAKNTQWMDQLNNGRDKMLQFFGPLITDWENVLTILFLKVRRIKRKLNNSVCKLNLKI